MVPERRSAAWDEKGMWRDGPNPGVLITADPATVERSGSFVRFETYSIDGSHGANGAGQAQIVKATGVAS